MRRTLLYSGAILLVVAGIGVLRAQPLVALHVGARVLEIADDVVRFEAPGSGGEPEALEFAADSVVVATGLVANPTLVEQLRAEGIEVRAIGDCTGVGYIEGAIHDGFRAAIEL